VVLALAAKNAPYEFSNGMRTFYYLGAREGKSNPVALGGPVCFVMLSEPREAPQLRRSDRVSGSLPYQTDHNLAPHQNPLTPIPSVDLFRNSPFCNKPVTFRT
jgi:hypothetical protein